MQSPESKALSALKNLSELQIEIHSNSQHNGICGWNCGSNKYISEHVISKDEKQHNNKENRHY